ncbi:hypothetical protein [Alteromonas macleodii]|nr:hypothetical protein [Alteromonas macleodii]MBL3811221.1 hypothetical protein [Alteromonas macleodii]MBL3884759.1 hypothetical protein [Alteromonas macleodii]
MSAQTENFSNSNQSWRHRCAVDMKSEITIWRYMSIEKWLSLLTTNKLLFSRLDCFADKNEVSFVVTKMKKLMDSSLHNGLDHHLTALKTYMYASCWNMGDRECRSLWYAYTGDARLGVAIKTSVKSVYNSLNTTYLPNCYKIDYETGYNDPEMLQVVDFPLTIKQPEYASEKELRFLINKPNIRVGNSGEPAQPLPQPTILLEDCNLDILIENFMITPFAETWQAKAIEEASYNLLPKLKGKLLKSEIYEL